MAAVTTPSSHAERAAVSQRSKRWTWRAWKARRERWYPWILAAIASASVWWWDPPREIVYSSLHGALPGAVSVAAILTGFLGASLALLFALLGSEQVNWLKQTKKLRPLVQYHWHAILILMIASVGCVVLMAIQGVTATFGDFNRTVAVISAFVGTSSVLVTFRVARCMVAMLYAHE